MKNNNKISNLDTLCCAVCGELSWSERQTVRGTSISQCNKCGLLATTAFLHENSNVETLYDVTPAEYASYCKQYLDSRLLSYRREMSKLERFRTTGRMLEIGSGYGFFLEMAKKKGWSAVGVEISKYACEIAAGKGCEAYNCTLQDAPFTPESFDVIVMWDVIEHFTSPAAVIRQCLNLIRPGGALVIKTPDARALVPSFAPIRTIYRHLVYPANTAEHVFHFTPENLSIMLKRVGFREIDVRMDDTWRERVISGNNFLVRGFRWMVMRYAYACKWPYEFILTGIK